MPSHVSRHVTEEEIQRDKRQARRCGSCHILQWRTQTLPQYESSMMQRLGIRATCSMITLQREKISELWSLQCCTLTCFREYEVLRFRVCRYHRRHTTTLRVESTKKGNQPLIVTVPVSSHFQMFFPYSFFFLVWHGTTTGTWYYYKERSYSPGRSNSAKEQMNAGRPGKMLPMPWRLETWKWTLKRAVRDRVNTRIRTIYICLDKLRC